MNSAESNMHTDMSPLKPAAQDLDAREPVWEALSDMFLDTDTSLSRQWRADLLACLKVHDGQTGFASIFDGMEFLSCNEIHNQWMAWKSLLDEGAFNGVSSAPDSGIKNDWWNPQWIPFTHNGGGDHLCLDLDPVASGAIGQVITMWHDMEDRQFQAMNFSEYFLAYVDGVLSGKYVYSEGITSGIQQKG